MGRSPGDGEKGKRQAYDDLAAELRRLGTVGGAGTHRMTLRRLLGAAGSSPAAATGAVQRMAERHPRAANWRALAKRWAALGAGGKEAALIELDAGQAARPSRSRTALTKNHQKSRTISYAHNA